MPLFICMVLGTRQEGGATVSVWDAEHPCLPEGREVPSMLKQGSRWPFISFSQRACWDSWASHAYAPKSQTRPCSLDTHSSRNTHMAFQNPCGQCPGRELQGAGGRGGETSLTQNLNSPPVMCTLPALKGPPAWQWGRQGFQSEVLMNRGLYQHLFKPSVSIPVKWMPKLL